ncbi:PIN domain-containing protein [Mesorhizobium wenxiniae]|uniref:DUF4935 domain-containing protein n=1 Tax=Mesorhizobium wenxiniae TaxID=2014805 RepID=A0A271K8P0_9HYPH|nr:PIN domain-containing protein [Mesorhizobium wenxiniae]PAP91405.1 hypothetical protein CIT31_32540 [Mesorhizobium wenxiniae]
MTEINLFIDTNVLLSFYHLTDEDIKELHKLVDALKDGTVILWTTSQLRDEFARNREIKIKDALKDFYQPNWRGKPPAFVREYDEFKQLKSALKEAGNLHNDLLEKVENDAKNRDLPADKLIKELFEIAKNYDAGQEIYALAIERMRRGNPPGKSSVTIGDQINWECLLKAVPDKGDLHLVSADGDFASPLYPDGPHYFLSYEWETKKNGKLFSYPKLSTFFGVHLKNIQLVKEQERKTEIQRLGLSGSFYSTHMAIAKLSQFELFTPEEFEDLINIACNNGQVGMIMADNDVKSFYGKLLEKLGDSIPKLSREALEAMLNP